MFAFYLLTFYFWQEMGYQGGNHCAQYLRLCGAQSIHTCAATAKESTPHYRNSFILMNSNWQFCLLIINSDFT